MNTDLVSKSLFKAKALDYLRRVEATGEAVVVTDNGRPTVEIRRYRSDTRSPLERLRGSVVAYHEPFESVSEGEWEALK
ncbi:MAG: type II toxin-antitoxin system prevent-host-death family antitoxin [Gammaproteobacteria bacterium]|nr:type II toxin-antitoxin system prevent-host-death family antitoxin [Gammaproteobacteria bacterium]